MRIAGFLILAIFLPAFAHAAPPTLTAYTISHDTLYPSATPESGLATTTSIDIAFSESVKASIKILSSSGSMIKSLYSSSGVINPAPKVWDGTNTAGAFAADGTYTILISATSTATGLPMTDASKTITITSPEAASSDADGTTAAAPASGAPPEYIPIPTLHIFSGGSRTVSSGADTAFTAVVYDGKGNKRDEALVQWSFGDGMQRTGANVLHAYDDPGEYVAVVHAFTPDGGDARSEMLVTVKNAGIRIVSVSSRGITLVNDDSRTLDLSLWRLTMGGQEFKIPADTKILAGRTVLFPLRVIELPIADSASLLYPSGEVASAYPGTAAKAGLSAQPILSAASYKSTEKANNSVGYSRQGNGVSDAAPSITSTNVTIQKNEEAVRAPAAPIELGAAGAAFPPEESAPSADTKLSGLFRSPWTLSFLGVMALAGGAFILL